MGPGAFENFNGKPPLVDLISCVIRPRREETQRMLYRRNFYKSKKKEVMHAATILTLMSLVIPYIYFHPFIMKTD